jgi:hypothetical protein
MGPEMRLSPLEESEGGWISFATYVPQNISGFRDYDPSTETTIEGTLYVYGISKLP